MIVVVKRSCACNIFLLSLLISYSGFGQSDARQKNHWPVNASLVTPGAADGAARLYQYLYDNYGSKIISGVYSVEEVQWLKTNTGKEPAVLGLDFINCGRGYTWYNDQAPTDNARAYYNRNGIPVFCWHWRDPSRETEEFYASKTSFDALKVYEPQSPEYQAMIADIDYISALLKPLQEENIPVIWRPLHEAKGGWFWWGAKGPAACKKLYQIMFDRMVNYHGLNNLIWVWTREPDDDLWYPGDEYVDIIGRDIYKEGDHSSQFTEWKTINDAYNKQKIVTLSECGSFPDPDNLKSDRAAWSWFMTWNGPFVRDSKYNSVQLWQKTMDHEYVITLDEMPDLRTYEAVVHPVVTGVVDSEPVLQAYPTLVADALHIKSNDQLGNVRVLSSQGNIVIDANVSERSTTLSVSALPPGFYVVRISTRHFVRFLKQ
jgi:mannan endo-1,4-beta-mannosidase